MPRRSSPTSSSLPSAPLEGIVVCKDLMATETMSASSTTSSSECGPNCCHDLDVSGCPQQLLTQDLSSSLLPPILLIPTQEESLRQSYGASPLSSAANASDDDNASTTTTTTTSRETCVRFGTLNVREFARRPGDNPGCKMGVSLTLDWEIQSELTVDLEDYEATRPARRDRGELNIPAEIRMQMLRDSGYSRGEILQSVKMTNIARAQRTRTNETQQLAVAQELTERLFRGVLNKSVRRHKKKQEKQVLQAHLDQDKMRRQSLLLLHKPETVLERKNKRRSSKEDEASLTTCPLSEYDDDEEQPQEEEEEDLLELELSSELTLTTSTTEVEC